MPAPNKNKWHLDGDRLTAEFSSGQLVIAICVSLFIALTCFLLGVLIGRYDGTQRIARQETTPLPASASTVPGAGQGVQTSPRQDLLQQRPEPVKKAAPAVPPAPRESRTMSPLKDLGPLPPPPQNTQEAEAPIPLIKQPQQETAPAAQETPATPEAQILAVAPAPQASPPAETPRVMEPISPEPAASPAQAEPAPLTAPAPSPEVTVGPVSAGTATAPAERGAFGIQVAAFSSANREAAALEFQRRMRDNAGLHSEIISDDKYSRVVIVGYKDRVSASAACNELKKKAGFADAFVLPLP